MCGVIYTAKDLCDHIQKDHIAQSNRNYQCLLKCIMHRIPISSVDTYIQSLTSIVHNEDGQFIKFINLYLSEYSIDEIKDMSNNDKMIHCFHKFKEIQDEEDMKWSKRFGPQIPTTAEWDVSKINLAI